MASLADIRARLQALIDCRYLAHCVPDYFGFEVLICNVLFEIRFKVGPGCGNWMTCVVLGVHNDVYGTQWEMFKDGSNAQGSLKAITRPSGYCIAIKIHPVLISAVVLGF